MMTVLISSFLFATILSIPSSYAATSFIFQNLSSDSVYSTDPRFVVSGSNVYVVWTSVNPISSEPDILFKASSDNGATFSAPISLSSDPGITPFLLPCDEINPLSCRGFPDVAVSGTNIYVVWHDVDGIEFDDEIFYRVSTDGGVSFSPDPTTDAAVNLSNDIEFSFWPIIDAQGSFVHIVWTSSDTPNDGLDIMYKRSTDSGANFDVTANNLSGEPIDGISQAPSMVLTDTDDVYVVWHTLDSTFFVGDIFFQASNDNGETFNVASAGLPINLANDVNDTFDSLNPRITAAGSNVYVAWEDIRDGTDFDILYRKSTDSGASFSPTPSDPPIDLSDNDSNSVSVDISTNSEGSKVYLTWQDGDGATDDVLFKKSIDFGDTFDATETNLSTNSGLSSFPIIGSSGDNVFVTWIDTTGIVGDTDVLFKSSDDGGVTFSSLQDLSDNDVPSDFHQMASVGDNVYVVWRDDVSDLAEILFGIGMPDAGGISINFDKSEYKLTDTVTITLMDTPLSGPKSVTVTSSEDVAGFSLDLIEAIPGTFTGTIAFSTDSSDPSLGILKVKVGGSIEVDFGGTSAIASIYPRVIAFAFSDYTLSDGAVVTPPLPPKPVIITVTDQNSNEDPLTIEIIEVDVTSITNPDGLIQPLILKETSENSGLFKNTNLIFTTGNGLLSVGDSLTVSQLENDPLLGYTTNGIVDTIKVEVKSTTDPVGFELTLTETDTSSGFFTGQLVTSASGPTVGNTIKVSDGDILTITYLGESINGLVIPNLDGTIGALEASIGDDITATYLGASDTATIGPGLGGGGGGGGFNRAGFVVNVVAGISAFGSGGSGGNAPPSFGQSSFAIIFGGEEGFGGILNDNDAKTLDETKTFKVGEKAVLRFDYTEGGGIGKIEHIGLYTNVRDGQKRQDSDAYIYFDPLKSPQVTVHDPNGLFSEANFELLQEDVTKFVLKFDLTFAKPMAKSDLILEAWNIKKWSSITKIPNAIEVLSSGIVQEAQSAPVETFLEDVTDDTIIPVWVKSNAKWWSDDTIDNDTFISGLEYLVNEGIIKVSLLDTTDNTSIPEVQPWIKSTAGWWADGMISEDEFITAIEWMITNNIIQVAA